MNRSEIEEILLQNTFLSDEGYVKHDKQTKFFYGIVSKEEFDLETIEKKDKLAGFFSGTLRGVENDMYVFLAIRAYRHRRVFFLLFLFVLACLGLLVAELAQNGIKALAQTEGGVFFAVTVALLGYLLRVGHQLDKKVKSSVDFFRGMLQADEVKMKNVPLIFQD